MTLTLDYSTGKVEGMGFGGNGNYIDILVKYDPVTRQGYGLHVQRVPATTNGNLWTLCRYDGNERTDLNRGHRLLEHDVDISGRLEAMRLAKTEERPIKEDDDIHENNDIAESDAPEQE